MGKRLMASPSSSGLRASRRLRGFRGGVFADFKFDWDDASARWFPMKPILVNNASGDAQGSRANDRSHRKPKNFNTKDDRGSRSGTGAPGNRQEEGVQVPYDER
jgi:hypothetical protein